MQFAPYMLARQIWTQEECARTFEEDLVFHLNHGYVIATPDVFAMFRWVDSTASEEEILGNETFSHADCWHVYAYAGDFSQAESLFPFPLPWISFERKNKLRIYRFQKMRAKWSSLNSKDRILTRT